MARLIVPIRDREGKPVGYVENPGALSFIFLALDRLEVRGWAILMSIIAGFVLLFATGHALDKHAIADPGSSIYTAAVMVAATTIMGFSGAKGGSGLALVTALAIGAIGGLVWGLA